jgi:hypothetical protein
MTSRSSDDKESVSKAAVGLCRLIAFAFLGGIQFESGALQLVALLSHGERAFPNQGAGFEETVEHRNDAYWNGPSN